MDKRLKLDAQHPWPGLATFGEGDQDYFRGRRRESDELTRLVRRERLTVLFGRSGLGKSSLLHAGLFPHLREDLHLPVYLRIDYAIAPSPRQQVLDALNETCTRSGIKAMPPEPDESLWAYFHRAGAGFWNPRRRPLLPVLVFDQFEEIFTLGQMDDSTRGAADAFIEELADLIEDRPSESLQEQLDADPALGEQMDFDRRGCKVLLSFREDFLADVEGLRGRMPSLMRNRFRLLPMDGAQALDVIGSGGDIVIAEVADRIVGLAWRNRTEAPLPEEVDRIEVDPALLSVICSELNLRRLAIGAATIESDLLAGAEREILVDFYERSLQGLDPSVRHFVEDELITATGYRDSRAFDDALARPGITSEALETLVAGRLLGMDERFGVRRLELTHDVLTRVVMDSRDKRHEREARERAERELQAEQEKVDVQAKQARRMRWVALFSGALAIVAVTFGIRAYDAEQEAIEHERTSNSRRLALLAINESDHSLDLALLLSAQAKRFDSTPEARDSLAKTLSKSPRLIKFLHGHTDRVREVAFHPKNPALLASVGDDKAIRLWDLETFEPHGGTPLLHKEKLFSVAFNHTGTILASGGNEKVIRFWDVETHKQVDKLNEPSGSEKVAFSSDGNLFASASVGTVGLWDVDMSKKWSHAGHDGQNVLNVAFSPDSKHLASSSSDKTVILWDVASGEQKKTLSGHEDEIEGLAFSPTDDTLLVSASRDKTIRFWDIGVKPLVPRGDQLSDTAKVMDVAFSPDGTFLASSNYAGGLQLWDVETRQPVGDPLTGHAKSVRGIAFSPDGKRIASASDDRKIGLWNLENPRQPTPFWSSRVFRGHDGGVASVIFSPNGERLASAGYDSTIRLWNVENSEQVGSPLTEHTDSVVTLAFNRDGSLLASGSNDKTVRLWDVATGTQIGPTLEHDEAVESVAFSADGKRLATGSRDRKVRLWDVETWELVGEPLEIEESQELWLNGSGRVKSLTSVAFSPDGEFLAAGLNVHGIGDFNFKTKPTGADKKEPHEAIQLWDLTNEPPKVVENGLRGHTETVFSVAFSPDSTLFASASRDRTVVLWDIATRKPVGQPLVHGPWQNSVLDVAFSSEGKRLATASYDKTVRLWDVETGRPIGPPLLGHNDVVESVAFSPDSKWLASASFDGTIRVWNVDESAWSNRACSIANRNLTLTEWNQYIGKQSPYCLTCPDLPAPEEALENATECEVTE
jgi:WD40 repeat protein